MTDDFIREICYAQTHPDYVPSSKWYKLRIPGTTTDVKIEKKELQDTVDCVKRLAPMSDSAKAAFMYGTWPMFVFPYKPTRIITNGPATIVFWNDNTKTVIKCMEEDHNDLYTAFCIALAKKMYGSNSKIKRVIDRALPPPMAMEEIGK